MTIYLYIWLGVVACNAIIRIWLFPLYFDLKPRERVERGYLTWNENFKYQHSKLVTGSTNLLDAEAFHYRLDIQFKGLYRALFGALDFKKELRKLNNHIKDVQAIDPHQYYIKKKEGKIHY